MYTQTSSERVYQKNVRGRNHELEKELLSERHMQDCIGIWNVQKGKLDEVYLQKRATGLGVIDLLKEISTGSLPQT